MNVLPSLSERMGAELGYPVRLVPSARASRLVARLDGATGGIRLTVPSCVSEQRVSEFVRRHAEVLKHTAARQPPRQRLGIGSVVRLFGVDRVVVRAAGQARLDDSRILVNGDAEAEMQAIAAIQQAAAARFSVMAMSKAAIIGRTPRLIGIEDARGRWGRRWADGAITIGWRIALAPPDVSDYVIAHEVAHLEEANHGARFWRICDSLATGQVDQARAWLAANSRTLLRFGPP